MFVGSADSEMAEEMSGRTRLTLRAFGVQQYRSLKTPSGTNGKLHRQGLTCRSHMVQHSINTANGTTPSKLRTN